MFMGKGRKRFKGKVSQKSPAAPARLETEVVHKVRTAAAYDVAAVSVFVVLGFLVYSNTLKSPFLFDDRAHIPENRHIRLTELDLKGIVEAGFESPSPTRPVANISFALNYYFHRYNVVGYHLTNIFIHILTGIFLYYFVKNTLSIPLLRSRYHSGRPIAFFASLLWLLHPLQTQSVSYIVQRMNSMAAMFYILSLLLYVKGRLSLAQHKTTWLWFAGCVVAGLLSLGSKEMAATLPVFILLYEWYFFQDLSTAWLKRYLPYVIAVFMVFCLVGLWYLDWAPFQKILSGYDRRDFTLTQRVLTQPRVVMYYISLLFYPSPGRLNLDHDFAFSYSLSSPLTTLISIAAIAGMIGLAVYAARRRRLLSFCVLWFFGNLVIESSVIGLELVFEHRVYLPSMLVPVAVAAVAWRYIKNNLVKIPMFCILILVCGIWTYNRNGVWADPVTLWTDCATKSPEKPRSQFNLALSLADVGRDDEAIEYYTRTLQLDPNRSDAHLGLGAVFFNKGKTDQAIGCFTEALRIKPEYPRALVSLGVALASEGRLDEAISCYRRAIRIKPDYLDAHMNLGDALKSKGRLDEAIYNYRQVLKINPGSVRAYTNLGAALLAKGELDEAVKCCYQALEIDPDTAGACNNLGVAFQSQGNFEEALRQYRTALRIDPNFLDVQLNLATLFEVQGDSVEALVHYREALRIAPDSTAALNGVAWMLAVDPQAGADKVSEAIRLAEQASRLTDQENPAILDTLAAAYAAGGQFDRAVETAETALEIASKSQSAELVGQVRERLELYRQRKRYSQPLH